MKKINNNSSINKILIFSALIAASWSPQNVFADVMTPTVTAVITPCDENDPLCNGGGGGGATPTPCPFVTVTPVETVAARTSNDVGTNKDQFNDPDGDPCGGGGGGATPTPIGTVTKTPCPTLAIDKFGNPIIPVDLPAECGGGGGTATPTPTGIGDGTVTPTPTGNGNGTVTPTPTGNGNGTVTPTPTGDGNGTVTPTPTGNGNGTVTPTPTGNGNGTVTPTPTGNGGNGTATPTPTSNGGGSGTATPTPTVGGFDNGGTVDYNVPPGCRVEVPYYKLKAILTTLDQYFGRRGYGRVTSLQKIHLDEVNNAQKSKLKKDFGKRNQNFRNLLGSARAALLPIPGVMVQCNEPPASCSKIEHPGLNVFEAQLKIVEQEMQANYKHALKGIAKKPRVLLFMRKEGSGAVKYMPRIAKKTKEASLALSGQISRSSFICR